ncbi:MAG: hypothetical protein EG828_08275 [Deltaproteobacteria bacterium]|nr:hypothetical protein [Deltaproteobacteria bacterium]
MENAPFLLDKLVSRTALQGVELLEFSLLKALKELVEPLELFILKLDSFGQPCHQLSLRNEYYLIISNNISLSAELQASIGIARRTKQPFNRQIESAMLTVWHVLATKSQEVFLVTTTSNNLSKSDAYMATGFVGVYRNILVNFPVRRSLQSISTLSVTEWGEGVHYS